MTLADYRLREQSLLAGRGGVIITAGDDNNDLANTALELYALTSGTLRIQGADGVQVDFTAADLTSLNNRIPFAVKRILATGTTVTRLLAIV